MVIRSGCFSKDRDWIGLKRTAFVGFQGYWINAEAKIYKQPKTSKHLDLGFAIFNVYTPNG